MTFDPDGAGLADAAERRLVALGRSTLLVGRARKEQSVCCPAVVACLLDSGAMPFDARIISQRAGQPIGLHRWISYALQCPVLRRYPWPEPSNESPREAVFSFLPDQAGLGCRLYWDEGEVVVSGVSDSFMADLEVIAGQLGGRVVEVETRTTEERIESPTRPESPFVQVQPTSSGPRCSAHNRLVVSDEGFVDLICGLLAGHAGPHRADIAPTVDGVAPIGFIEPVTW